VSKLILDAGPLITTCKFSVAGRLVVDHILDHCEIAVAASVRDEVVIAGRRYPDAQAAQQRIDGAQITVLVPPPDPEWNTRCSCYRGELCNLLPSH